MNNYSIKIMGIDYDIDFSLNSFSLIIPNVCVIQITRDNHCSYYSKMFFYDSKFIFCSGRLRSKNSVLSFIQEKIDFLNLSF